MKSEELGISVSGIRRELKGYTSRGRARSRTIKSDMAVIHRDISPKLELGVNVMRTDEINN